MRSRIMGEGMGVCGRGASAVLAGVQCVVKK